MSHLQRTEVEKSASYIDYENILIPSVGDTPPPGEPDPIVSLPTRLVQATDMHYEGSFRLPAGTINGTTFDFGGGPTAYYAVNNSLFAAGHPASSNSGNQEVAEVGVAASLSSDANVDNLPVGPLLQTFRDISEGRLNVYGQTDPNGVLLGGLLVHAGKLHFSGYAFYGGAGNSHFRSGLTLATAGDVEGPFTQVAPLPGMNAGVYCDIPAVWQPAFGGKKALSGNSCKNIISSTSYGPALFAINPADFGVLPNPIPSLPCVYYYPPHALQAWDSSDTPRLFNGTAKVAGVIFPKNTASVLFFGRIGLGHFRYGEGTSNQALDGTPVQPPNGDTWWYDPEDSDKGCHGYPYSSCYVWAYDARDLASAAAGTKSAYSVTPYAIWQLNDPYPPNSHVIRGASYDAATGRMYISQAGRVIQVWTINAA